MPGTYRIQYNEEQDLFSITTEDEKRSTPASEVPEDGRAHVLFDGKELFVTLAGYDGPCPEDTVFDLTPNKTLVDTVDFDEEGEEEGEETPDSKAVGVDTTDPSLDAEEEEEELEGEGEEGESGEEEEIEA